MSAKVPAKVQQAREAHERAAEALNQAAKEAYPVGALVRVLLGRARVVGVVVGHTQSWWSNPGEVRIQNIFTGKRREFAAWSDVYEAELVAFSAEMREAPFIGSWEPEAQPKPAREVVQAVGIPQPSRADILHAYAMEDCRPAILVRYLRAYPHFAAEFVDMYRKQRIEQNELGITSNANDLPPEDREFFDQTLSKHLPAAEAFTVEAWNPAESDDDSVSDAAYDEEREEA